MARHASSPAPASLPKVSFTKVLDEYSSHPAGVADLQARSYGYNDGSNFKRPDNYIRYIEPLESELAQQVEYDMDDQDREWLESVNADRRKEQLDKVSYEVFEIVMDKLEKEWFDLTKTIPKPDFAMPSEDSTCAICDDSEGENTNAIVFCDGCNLAVHQDCYGVPYIPEGQWLCRKCTVSPENPVSCILCPNEGGAFKQTVQGEWVHLLCAIWVPETRVANEVFMEPITGVDTITKPRWRLKCSLCDVRMGACIQCIKSSCTLAFHATCARKEKLLMPMKATQGSEAPVLACYCEKHLPREQAEARAAALASEKVDGVGDADNQKSSKTARAYAKTYKLGPPLVPKIIVDRLMQYIGKVTLRQKREFVILVCKYWSLKREARRGAPLLKRLHLEPWTASNSGRNHSEEDKMMKLEMLKKLKTDLDKTRELAQLSKQRETQKLLQARAVYKLLKRTLLPSQAALRAAFARIVGFDRQDFFKSPVSRIDVPDYYDIVKQPICWDVIDKKLSSYEYMDLDDLKKDVYLVLDNALLYNRPDTPYSKAALKIKSHADRILTELEQAKVLHPELPDNSVESSEPEASSSRLLVGDLEPPLEVLQPLFSRDSIANDMETILETDPTTSLFSFEFAKEKPPPTPPPPKPKRDRKADLDRARQERIAVAGERAMTRSTGGALTDSSRPSLEPIDAEIVEGQIHEDHHDERRRKRPKIVLPGHADVPPVVDEVDGREMFMKFDVGWILPDTTRRGGRAPVDRHPIEPRRKKPKTERERSHLSTEGTAVAPEDMAGPSGHAHEGEATINSVPMHVPEDEAVKMQVDDAVQLPETPQPDSAMDVSPLVASDVPVLVVDPQPSNTEMDLALDQEQPVTEETPDIVNAIIYPPDSIPVNTDIQVERQREESLHEAAAEVGPEAGVEAETRAEAEVDAAAQEEEEEEDERPVQVIVIDVLDTPATRREKNMRRKAERLRKSSFGGPQPGPSRPGNGEHSIDMQNSGNPDSDAHSELTALSSDEEDQDDRNSAENAIAPEPSHEVRVQDLGKVILEKDQRLPHKTLVWAKTLGYPWWPASVVDPDSPDATLAPKASDPVKARKEQLHLVRYFDGKNGKVDDTWQWVSPPNMRLFGNFEELDEDMVANKSKMQRWNKEKAKSQCRKAYQRAKEESSGDRSITQVAKPNDAEV